MIETKAIEEFQARPYQQAIIDVCIKRNSIVFLPTGAGKSYIAIQVIRHFSKDIERKYSEGGKRSVFLVNTVCLAKQQAESIADLVPFKVRLLCGEQNVDLWKEKEWIEVLEDNQILVSTAQVILDAIKFSFINLEQINVLVFDECHHGRKCHVYHELMKQFPNPMSGNARIVGLSGMLIGINGKIKSETVTGELQQLEATFQSTIITVNNIDDHQNVLLYATNASEALVRFTKEPERPGLESISDCLKQMEAKLKQVTFANYKSIHPKTLRETTPGKIKDLINMFNDFDYQAKDMGPFGGYLSLLGTLVQLELIARWTDTEKHRSVVKSCITVIELCIKKMENTFGFSRNNLSTIMTNSSNKVRSLYQLLQMKFNDPNREKDLQCLVFVKRRSTAKALYHCLKALASVDSEFPIKPDFMVGVNNDLPESIEVVLSSNYNSFSLEKFKNKETNVIVASSVLEEGIDLQMCNLVVLYDKPDTYRSYVQARGRARVNNSSYVVLVEHDKVGDFTKKIITWREVDTELKRQLLMKTLDREPPTKEDIEKEREEAWEPFITPISKSVLNSLNAVSLLNHYASKLPSDRFTNCNVYWRRIDHEDGTVTAALELPLNSNIKDEIVGDPQVNVRLAKQHAAFKACIMLYENGELNDNLVPIDEKQKIEMFNDEYFPHWDAYSKDNAKSAGTRKNRRYHKMSTPKVLENCAPKVGGTSYLYHIKIKPKFEAPSKGLKEFHNLLSDQKDFGILTSKRLPRLCEMVLFQTFGEICVEIDSLPFTVVLKEQAELEVLQNFHVAVFKDVVETWQHFYVLDNTSYLIVPLTESIEIDWNLAREFQHVEKPRSLSYDEINKTEFTRRAYIHRVVNPVYKGTNQKYVVIDVLEHMTPQSPFPHSNYSSYKEYFELKFDLKIVKGSQQPMIEVKGISSNLQMFFPGGGSFGKQRKYEKEQLPEHFIPELCHNFKFPAGYWLKATLLPAICHRVHYMLLAEELRVWLIDQRIDESNGSQTLKLDVDYGNYDERDKMIREVDHQHETEGRFPNARLLRELKQDSASSTAGAGNHSSALQIWNRAELPIDIDRNWLTVTEVDLIYYCNFLKSNSNLITPATLSRLQQLNGPISRSDRCLMDTDERQDIKILKLTSKLKAVQQKDLIKVLTTSNAGDVFDMERYEVLGDGFLKFISSIYLYKKYEDWHEGYLTTLKGKIVSNRNLFYVGNNFGLSGRIKSMSFDPMESLPPSIKIPFGLQTIVEREKKMLVKMVNIEALTHEEIMKGEINQSTLKKFENNRNCYEIAGDPTEAGEDDMNMDMSYLSCINQHIVGDKIVADAVEAFLGVVVQTLGIHAGLKLCLKLKILPETENIGDLLTETIPPRELVKNASPNEFRVQNRDELESIIGYRFKEPKYLLQALTHASHPIKPMGSYQQLEFLGDAVLDFLVTSYITEKCPKLDPGKLTDLRSALVNNVTLACVVVRNNIHKYLLSGDVLLSEAIKRFVVFQNSKENRVVLDQILLLETEDEAATAEAVDVPKVVGDLFESIIGAVYLDCGLNLETTWSVIYGLLKQELNEFIIEVPMQIIRQLYEYEKGSAEPKFFDAEVFEDGTIAVPLEINCGLDNDGIKVKKVFVGIAKNKFLAKKCAAKLAMKALRAIKTY